MCLEKIKKSDGNQGTHEIPATSQFMVRQANHWAMGYGDVCLSSLWASYNVIKQNASVVLSSATWYFFVLWATPNGKLLVGLGKSQDISEYTEH